MAASAAAAGSSRTHDPGREARYEDLFPEETDFVAFFEGLIKEGLMSKDELQTWLKDQKKAWFHTFQILYAILPEGARTTLNPAFFTCVLVASGVAVLGVSPLRSKEDAFGLTVLPVWLFRQIANATRIAQSDTYVRGALWYRIFLAQWGVSRNPLLFDAINDKVLHYHITDLLKKAADKHPGIFTDHFWGGDPWVHSGRHKPFGQALLEAQQGKVGHKNKEVNREKFRHALFLKSNQVLTKHPFLSLQDAQAHADVVIFAIESALVQCSNAHNATVVVATIGQVLQAAAQWVDGQDEAFVGTHWKALTTALRQQLLTFQRQMQTTTQHNLSWASAANAPPPDFAAFNASLPGGAGAGAGAGASAAAAPRRTAWTEPNEATQLAPIDSFRVLASAPGSGSGSGSSSDRRPPSRAPSMLMQLLSPEHSQQSRGLNMDDNPIPQRVPSNESLASAPLGLVPAFPEDLDPLEEPLATQPPVVDPTNRRAMMEPAFDTQLQLQQQIQAVRDEAMRTLQQALATKDMEWAERSAHMQQALVEQAQVAAQLQEATQEVRQQLIAQETQKAQLQQEMKDYTDQYNTLLQEGTEKAERFQAEKAQLEQQLKVMEQQTQQAQTSERAAFEEERVHLQNKLNLLVQKHNHLKRQMGQAFDEMRARGQRLKLDLLEDARKHHEETQLGVVALATRAQAIQVAEGQERAQKERYYRDWQQEQAVTRDLRQQMERMAIQEAPPVSLPAKRHRPNQEVDRADERAMRASMLGLTGPAAPAPVASVSLASLAIPFAHLRPPISASARAPVAPRPLLMSAEKEEDYEIGDVPTSDEEVEILGEPKRNHRSPAEWVGGSPEIINLVDDEEEEVAPAAASASAAPHHPKKKTSHSVPNAEVMEQVLVEFRNTSVTAKDLKALISRFAHFHNAFEDVRTKRAEYNKAAHEVDKLDAKMDKVIQDLKVVVADEKWRDKKKKQLKEYEKRMEERKELLKKVATDLGFTAIQFRTRYNQFQATGGENGPLAVPVAASSSSATTTSATGASGSGASSMQLGARAPAPKFGIHVLY